ncbi:protease HtpX [Marinobacter daepoensis]|uniref:Protease HtpX n=1 Tax=Marinobacter daepoensis TaxID=262077 RepID=A0ABS3BD66_9GAMM|nr:protease HtpX [Marinobacter daepoensis]MBN7769432.1 protease HtpX [Marinobacter daepoensis]MBY6031907.1 protease HtpX [Marinobacter daepoensis]MBY6078122.1 protease HtpX [Marinobacter daepoensis]
MRILLFLATNLAVILVASVTLRLLGVDSYLAQQGIDYGSLLAFAAVFGFAGAFISLFLSKPMAKWSTKARVIDSPRTPAERWLVETVADLAKKAGIGMPEVAIFPAQQSNAFATGWNKNDSLVAVSEGLLSRFSKDEIRAVLGHEIGHVANGDMVTLTLIQGIVNTFVIFASRVIGSFVDRVIFKNENGHGIGFFVVSIVAEIVLGILASTIVFWFSRRREYRADIAGAQLAGRGAMIAALARLKQESEVPDQMPDTLQAFGINRGAREGLAAMFMTHPPLEDRIAALQNAAV